MKQAQHNRIWARRLLPAALTLAFSSSGFAAEEVLEEVIITAQKRVEKLQDVPISITAISGSQLENRGILGAANLNALAPNVTVKSAQPGSGLTAAVNIRGIGGGQPGIWSDNSIGMYLDGVYIGKTQGALLDMLDLQRVEVLRGPQGTLFGKNTEGGAINFITRKPSGEFGGSVGFDIGNHGQQVVKAAMDLPQMGILRLGFTLRDEKRDGTITNPNGRDWNERNRDAQRLVAGLDITDAFKIDYAYDHSNINDTPPAISLYSATGYAPLFPLSASGQSNAYFDRVLRPRLAPYASTSYPTAVGADAGQDYFNKLKVQGHALTASYTANPENTYKYIVAKRKMHYQEMMDLDGTPVNVFNAGKDTYYDTTSHELQWVGTRNDFNFVAGLYWFKDDGATLSDQMGQYFTFGFAPPVHRQLYYQTQTDAKAAYGQIDYRINEAWGATLGIRRSWEEKQGFLWSTQGPMGNPGAQLRTGFEPRGAEAKFAATTPVAALTYKWSEQVTLFGRVARGFKSGGFPLEAENPRDTLKPFNQQNSTAFELGLKSRFNNNKAQLNATLFSTNVSDYHVNQLPPGGISPVTVNAGKMKNQGFEIEGLYQLADGWRLQASYGYLHAKFKRYDSYNQYGALVDVAENTEASYAPRHQLTLNLDGVLARTDWGTLRGIVDYTFTSAYLNYHGQKSVVGTNVAVGNTNEESRMPVLQTVNARLLLSRIPIGGPGVAEISLWGRNLNNAKKQTTHIDLAGFYRVAGWTDPRMVGLGFNYTW